MRVRFVAVLAALSCAVVGLGASLAVAADGSVRVSSEGELLAAVGAANADPSITSIVFERQAVIELTDEVRFTGSQDITLFGRGATLSGATVGPDVDTGGTEPGDETNRAAVAAMAEVGHRHRRRVPPAMDRRDRACGRRHRLDGVRRRLSRLPREALQGL